MLDLIKDILAIVGGATVILFAVSRFFGDLIKETFKARIKLSSDKDLERTKQEFAIRRIAIDNYVSSQYESYLELWALLRGVNEAVDRLWEDVSPRNISDLAKKASDAKSYIDQGSLFFEEQHIQSLQLLFEKLDSFCVGKKSLLYEFEEGYVDSYDGQDTNRIRQMVASNREYRNDWCTLLSKIRTSFKERLSEL
ncbi:hypothetical protein PDESU_04277 [Pontiella desulfatans]|uniref:DUF4760 domain-containing protein n=1 Tax=Pontiella desulfatans TaxID=2750659 RepID=A0A6C2U6J3_PONDE|nr:hypothetical protein [Pontiella desulfatans]VGO15692.1 hypothetical protein PDESU_04277 [Pontiella desulfatans]